MKVKFEVSNQPNKITIIATIKFERPTDVTQVHLKCDQMIRQIKRVPWWYLIAIINCRISLWKKLPRTQSLIGLSEVTWPPGVGWGHHACTSRWTVRDGEVLSGFFQPQDFQINCIKLCWVNLFWRKQSILLIFAKLLFFSMFLWHCWRLRLFGETHEAFKKWDNWFRSLSGT